MRSHHEMLPVANAPQAGAADRIILMLGAIPDWLILFAARLFPAAVFWRSGQTKLDGWQIADRTFFLFEEEYRLPLIDPETATYLATWSEHAFPILLVLGLASRFSALALLVMTLTIQIFVYPAAWPTHGVWATCFLVVIAKGPGALSLDHLAWRWFRRGEVTRA